jgi:hypothetical protein
VIPDFAHWLTAEKSFGVEPWWYFDSPAQDRYVLSVPLVIEHVAEEGFFLAGNCMRNLPDREVSFSLVYNPAAGLSGPLSRIDWKPLQEHRNNGLVKGEFKWKPFTDTHIHPFSENHLLGLRRMWQDNLPRAYPITDSLPGFRELHRLCE